MNDYDKQLLIEGIFELPFAFLWILPLAALIGWLIS